MCNSSEKGCPLSGSESEFHSVARTDLAWKIFFTAREACDDVVIHEIFKKYHHTCGKIIVHF